MVTDQTFWHFFTAAGPIVKGVMLILLVLSVASWTYIFQRAFFFSRIRKRMQAFEKNFWSGVDMSKLYAGIEKRQGSASGLAKIFTAGFKEFLQCRDQTQLPAATKLEAIERAMQIAKAQEIARLEKHLSFLATVGSIAPYIGLFGTVWGIMTSFQALGSVQQATITMVAPGISEALIATAMGLFAAIPAVIAYNRYANQVESLINQFSIFQGELSNILCRQTGSSLQEA